MTNDSDGLMPYPGETRRDAPSIEKNWPPHAGFVIYDPRQQVYLATAAVRRGMWSPHAGDAHIYESRSLAETVLRAYGADRPEAFVHPVTPDGPAPNMPGAV